jgi:choline-sulfatase
MKLSLLPVTLLLGLAGVPVAVHAAEKPNILVLFTDDQAVETIRALGNIDIDTPNLDRLVARGTTFTHAYNMGSYSPAVCVASRTMLMTGRSLWDAQRLHANADSERAAGRLWPQLLSRAGYRTYFTGKWHVRADATLAFDRVSHVRPGMPKDLPAGYGRPLAGQPDPWSPSDPALGGFWEGGTHWTEVTADDAISFLAEAKARPEPFFMYVAFNAPHDPRQSPQAYVDRYPLERIAMPAPFLAEYPHNEAMGAGRTLRDERLAPFPRTEHAVKVHRAEYYAMMTHLDDHIGRVLTALEQSGRADNTWILLTSDHGLAVGRHGLFGKQNMYEHSLRVPFVVVGPGVAAGRRIANPVYLQDLMATSLEIAGAERPDHVFFKSVLPQLFREEAPQSYPEIYGAYLDQQRAIIHGGYKLIFYPKVDVVRLYHLARDPEEVHDLAHDPAHRAIREDLVERLRRLQEAMDDPLFK